MLLAVQCVFYSVWTACTNSIGNPGNQCNNYIHTYIHTPWKMIDTSLPIMDWKANPPPPSFSVVNASLWFCCVALVQGNILLHLEWPPTLPTCVGNSSNYTWALWEGCHMLAGFILLHPLSSCRPPAPLCTFLTINLVSASCSLQYQAPSSPVLSRLLHFILVFCADLLCIAIWTKAS